MANTRRMTFSHEAGRHRPDQPTVARLCPFEVNLSLSRLRRARFVNWVKMDGHKNVLGVKIDPEVAGDVEMLQDMVLAACNEAAKKVDQESQQKMSGMLGGMGLDRKSTRLNSSHLGISYAV